MSEPDVIRLMMAIGVLVLMAVSAGFGILWQRQQNLVTALQGVTGARGFQGQIEPPEIADAASAADAQQPLHGIGQPFQTRNSISPTPPFHNGPVAMPAQPSAAFATEAARYQSMIEDARSGATTARDGAGKKMDRLSISAPFGASRNNVSPGATRTAAASLSTGMLSEEDRLRALLAGKGGRGVTPGRGIPGREPRLF
jgi:hypothetical protein